MLDLVWKVILLYLDKGRLAWLRLEKWVWKTLRSFIGHTTVSSPMPPMPKPDATVDTPECRIAVHEVGHAMAAWSCTAVSKIVHVTLNVENTKGGVLHSVGTTSTDHHWCSMAIALAGVAAEGHVYGSWRSGPARGDLAAARELCAAVHGTAQPWQAAGDDAIPDFCEFFDPPLSAWESWALGQSYDLGRRLVEAHGTSFTRCVSMLLHRRHLTEADLTTALGTRAFLRVLNTMGSARFVFPGEPVDPGKPTRP